MTKPPSPCLDAFSLVRLNRTLQPGEAQRPSVDEYLGILPLDAEGNLDERAWQAYPSLCRISYRDEHGLDGMGCLSCAADGRWTFRYVNRMPEAVPAGAGERFQIGRTVSVVRDGRECNYRVTVVRPINL